MKSSCNVATLIERYFTERLMGLGARPEQHRAHRRMICAAMRPAFSAVSETPAYPPPR